MRSNTFYQFRRDSVYHRLQRGQQYFLGNRGFQDAYVAGGGGLYGQCGAGLPSGRWVRYGAVGAVWGDLTAPGRVAWKRWRCG